MNPQNYQWTPPPRRLLSSVEKLLLLGVQCLVLMIGALVIWILTYERNSQQESVTQQISRDWGEKTFIDGPLFKSKLDSASAYYPDRLDATVEVDIRSLHRNIYEAEVFTAKVTLTGYFCKDSLLQLGDKAMLVIDLSGSQVTDLPPMKLADRTVTWKRQGNFAFSSIDLLELPKTIDYSIYLEVKGSSAIAITPCGMVSDITMSGEAANPSFGGMTSPMERCVNGNKFEAKWHREWSEDELNNRAAKRSVVTTFLVGVDRYKMVERSLKYSFIFIVLTYISVFCAETVLKRRIPLVNYFLVGVGLILFYSLLLSFVEQIPFFAAYLIAALMTIGLITGYMWRLLKSRKAGLTICAILVVLYSSCYVLLSLSTYALLLGSLLLFCALAFMMYVSIKMAPKES